MATTHAKQEGTKAPKNSAEEQGVEVDSGKCRETEPASGQRTTEALLSPATLTATKRMQAALDKLEAFRSTGDHEHLEELLRAFPEARSHPFVAAEFDHLRKLSRMPTLEFESEMPRYAFLSWLQCTYHDGMVQVRLVPVETKKAAHEALRRLTQAELEGTLPGHRVRQIGSGSGHDARRKWHPADEALIKEIFYDLLATIASLPEAQRKRGPNETASDFKACMAKVVQKLHSDSRGWQLACHKYPYGVPQNQLEMSKDSDSEGDFLTDPFFTHVAPLPEEVAADIVEYAASGQHPKILSPKRLVHALLAEYLDTSEDSIRGLIDRTE